MIAVERPEPTAPKKRAGDFSTEKTVTKKPLYAAVLDSESHVPGSSIQNSAEVAAALQVTPVKRPQVLTPENAAYWASICLPPTYHDCPLFLKEMPEPFNPIPPHPHEIDMLFVLQPDGTEKMDYEAMHALLYNLVHPGIQESTTHLGQTVHHSFINLAVIPDFILYDDHALQILGLK